MGTGSFGTQSGQCQGTVGSRVLWYTVATRGQWACGWLPHYRGTLGSLHCHTASLVLEPPTGKEEGNPPPPSSDPPGSFKKNSSGEELHFVWGKDFFGHLYTNPWISDPSLNPPHPPPF